MITDDASSTSLFGPPHIYFPDSSQCLHHRLPRQTKAIRVSLVWFGSGPPKTNTCKPYNMVICSGWGKERGFINNGANQAHIKIRFGLLGGRRGVHWGVRWNRGYSIRGWLLFQKGTRGTYRLSVSRHWQPRRLTLHVSPMGEMGIWHACAYIHVYMNIQKIFSPAHGGLCEFPLTAILSWMLCSSTSSGLLL